MKLSYTLMYDGNPRDAADQVAGLEKAGIDLVWVAEAYGFDSPTLMGYLAARTETVEIGSAILNVYSRTPGTLLQTAAGLDNVSGGRAVLGLGASGPQVIEGWHGVPYSKPLARTAEIIDLVRRGLKRERLESDGVFKLPLSKEDGAVTGLGKPLKLLTHPERDTIPIWIAALGPKSVEQAAAIADGWIPHLFHPERPHLVWGDALAAGAAQRSPDLGPLEITAGGMVAIGEGPRPRSCSTSRARSSRCTSAAWAPRARTSTTTWPRRTATSRRRRRSRTSTCPARRRTPRRWSPPSWLEACNLVGPASYVKERIAAFREAGVTHLTVMPASDNPAATVAQVKEWVS